MNPCRQVAPRNHWKDWADNCLGAKKPLWTPFDIGWRITEPALAVKATRFPGQELRWDAANFRFTNHDKANAEILSRNTAPASSRRRSPDAAPADQGNAVGVLARASIPSKPADGILQVGQLGDFIWMPKGVAQAFVPSASTPRDRRDPSAPVCDKAGAKHRYHLLRLRCGIVGGKSRVEMRGSQEPALWKQYRLLSAF